MQARTPPIRIVFRTPTWRMRNGGTDDATPVTAPSTVNPNPACAQLHSRSITINGRTTPSEEYVAAASKSSSELIASNWLPALKGILAFMGQDTPADENGLSP